MSRKIPSPDAEDPEAQLNLQVADCYGFVDYASELQTIPARIWLPSKFTIPQSRIASLTISIETDHTISISLENRASEHWL